MDTSIALDGAVAIDRVDYVLNGLAIPRQDFTPRDWLRILKEVLAEHRPHAKYLPYFTDHSDALLELNRISAWTPLEFRARPRKVDYSISAPGVTAATRLLPLGALSGWHTSASESEWRVNRLKEDYLFLTDKLEFVGMYRLVSRGKSQGGVWVYEVEEYLFYKMTEEKLLELVGNRGSLLGSLIYHVQVLAKEAIAAKERRISAIRDAISHVDQIVARIKA